MNKCEHLKEFLDVEIKLIERHIDEHKWFNHIENKEEAIEDFIGRFGWLMREFFCEYICTDRDKCTLLQNNKI